MLAIRRSAVFSIAIFIVLTVFASFTVSASPRGGSVPTLTIVPVDDDVPEGTGAGSTSAEFLVYLSAMTDQNVSFTWSTVDGDAVAGDDFTGVSSVSATILAGESSVTVSTAVVRDSTFEYEGTETGNRYESMGATIANPVNATIALGTASLIIEDDDSVPSVSISSHTATSPEGTPFPPDIPACTFQLDLTLTLTNASDQLIDVTLTATDGTATLADSDYELPIGSVGHTMTFTFVPGDSEILVALFSVCDDIIEPDESFTVAITGSVNAPVGSSTPVTFTLENDDFTVELLTDSGFENDGSDPRQGLHRAWVVSNGSSDKVRCEKLNETFAYDGKCVFTFKASASENSAVSQTVKQKKLETCPSDTARTTFAMLLTGASQGNGASKTGYKLIYWDVKNKKHTLKKAAIRVSAGWTTWSSAPLRFEKTPTKIKVSLYNTSKKGKVSHDDVHLYCGDTDHFRAARVIDGPLLPPPAAPDGFRHG